MNTTQKLFALLALASSFAPLGQAAEYKTMFAKTSDVTLSVLPTDLVEVISGCGQNGNFGGLAVQIEDDSWVSGTLTTNQVTSKWTGIKAVKLQGGGSYYPYWLTLKITAKEETTAAGPTSVLVIPENSTGNYDVVVESSGDMTTWTPFVSQTVLSSTPSNFFRVRIVKK